MHSPTCYVADIGHHHSLKHGQGDKRNGAKHKEKDEGKKTGKASVQMENVNHHLFIVKVHFGTRN